MNIGAIFRKCDFQVHTPRDPNWKGERIPGIDVVKDEASRKHYTSEEIDCARRQWASSFVDVCNKKNLQAVAITDHHEMVMAAYVKEEISQRIANDDDPNLWLFPGMELTLKGGVQCIILFDVDLETDQWSGVQSALKINIGAVDVHHSKGAKVEQLELEYESLEDDLNKYEPIRGRFIILPNVSQGGPHTVVTQGKHKAFRKMPYVGGYLDNCNNENDLSENHKGKIFGKTKAWGDRVIYPLPTSDCREHNYPTLGNNNTWIKLAEPTTESIRQAFLSFKSRIAIKEPELPTARIIDLTIKGSSIIKEDTVHFNPELNTVIGGRGTGKSTIHEYLCFGLGRSNRDLEKRSYEGSERLKALIDETIISQNAEVRVTFMLDGAEFSVTRKAENNYAPILKYPDGTSAIIDPAKLREHFPGQALSQGELSEIGRMRSYNEHLDGLLNFVQSSYRLEARELLKHIELGRRDVKSAFLSALDYWQKEDERNNALEKHRALSARIASLQKSIPELSDEEHDIISRYAVLSDEGKKTTSMTEEVSGLENVFSKIITDRTSDFQCTIDNPPASLAGVYEKHNQIVSNVVGGVKLLQEKLEEELADLEKLNATWASDLKNMKKQRDQIMAKVGAKQSVTKQIDDLQQQSSALVAMIESLSEKLRKLDEPMGLLNSSRQKLFLAVNERAKKLGIWCAEIEKASGGLVSAVVSENEDCSNVYQALEVLVEGTGSKTEYRSHQFSNLCKEIGLSSLLEEVFFESIISIRSKLYPSTISTEQSTETPRLNQIVAKSDNVLEELKQRLDGERVSQILVAIPSPKVSFKYNTNGEKIEFGKASEGQRAAALLTLLLHQKGGPLIIDQPEGDLDNKIISDIAAMLHSSKSNRQLIMVTHNANLVVNGSAELVQTMGGDENGKRSIQHSGAIDKTSIRDDITTVMEGGKAAFKDRQAKYGF